MIIIIVNSTTHFAAALPGASTKLLLHAHKHCMLPIHCLSAPCDSRNIVEFIGAGEVKPGDVPGQFACEFVVQVRTGCIHHSLCSSGL